MKIKVLLNIFVNDSGMWYVAETEESHSRYNTRNSAEVSVRAEHFATVWSHPGEDGPYNLKVSCIDQRWKIKSKECHTKQASNVR